MPWIRRAANSARRERPALLACRSAVSADMTTSPNRPDESDWNGPSRIGNERTSVLPAIPLYRSLSRAIVRSPTSSSPHSAPSTPILARVVSPTLFRNLVSSLIFLCRFVTQSAISLPPRGALFEVESRIIHAVVIDSQEDPDKALLD